MTKERERERNRNKENQLWSSEMSTNEYHCFTPRAGFLGAEGSVAFNPVQSVQHSFGTDAVWKQ